MTLNKFINRKLRYIDSEHINLIKALMEETAHATIEAMRGGGDVLDYNRRAKEFLGEMEK